jgi:diguanylate cyclase (GGDEF)-like protein/PAS domain S-box-containing protein/putative nucleotidyltransferase with HDIG domain
MRVAETGDWESANLAQKINELLAAQDQSKRQLQASRMLLQLICGQSNEMVWLVEPDGTFRQLNSACRELGYEPESLKGESCFVLLHPQDRAQMKRYLQLIVKTGSAERAKFRFQHRRGQDLWMETIGKASRAEDGMTAEIVIICRAVAQGTIKGELDNQDELTKLYSRGFFERQLALDSNDKLPVSIIVCDVNGLKRINRRFGYSRGDESLLRITEVLQACCREEDLIARWGEDEFVLALPQTSYAEAEILADWIKDNAENGKEETIALGIATKTAQTQHLRQIMAEAEAIMEQNKLFESGSRHNLILKVLQNLLAESAFETQQHSQRLYELSISMGRAMGLSRVQLTKLRLLALFHDLGKISVPAKILRETGALTSKEIEAIKNHPSVGYRIARSIPELSSVAEEILSHHERWDGEGYPRGLKGTQIPPLARLIAVVDAFDVMTQGRIYCPAVSGQEALLELEKCAGTQFDPELVKVFVSTVKNVASDC